MTLEFKNLRLYSMKLLLNKSNISYSKTHIRQVKNIQDQQEIALRDQAKNLLESLGIYQGHTTLPQTYPDIIALVCSFTPSELSIFNRLLIYFRYYRSVTPSQMSLAIQAGGYCRKTANRVIKKLCSLGFIVTTYRHMKTSIYKLHPIFKFADLRARLHTFLPALTRSFSGFRYFGPINKQNDDQSINVPLTKKNNECINKTLQKKGETTSKTYLKNNSSTKNVVFSNNINKNIQVSYAPSVPNNQTEIIQNNRQNYLSIVKSFKP